MNITLFSTNERGHDHGPCYYMTTSHSKATEITRQEYLALLDLPGEWREGDYYITDETPHDAPRTHEGKRVVLVATLDGKIETDADWMARQGERDMRGRRWNVLTDFGPSPNDTVYDFLAGTGRL